MRAKEFFRQVRVAEEELKMLNAKLQHFEDLGMSISSGTGGTLGNKNRATSRVELAAIGAVELLPKQRQSSKRCHSQSTGSSSPTTTSVANLSGGSAMSWIMRTLTAFIERMVGP